jgi:large repetitive protein
MAMATQLSRRGAILASFLFFLTLVWPGSVSVGRESLAAPDSGIQVVAPAADGEPVGMPGTLTLLVQDADSQAPISGASISVTDDMTSGVVATGQTGEDGFYVSEELPSGMYTAHVSANGYESFDLPVWIDGPASSPVWLMQLPAQALLTIVVSDAISGQPIAGANVSVYGPSSVTGMTDETGTFNAGATSVGSYSVSVSAPGYVTGFFAFEVSGDQTISIALQPVQSGVLTVTVIDRYTGTPVENANVAVYDPRSGSTIATGTTGPDGVYVTGEIPGGWYELTGSAEGYYSGSTSVQVQGPTSATVALDSRPAGMLTVSVSDGTSGLALEGARIVVRNSDGSEAASGMTDVNGRFATGAIGEGYFFVSVSAEAYVSVDESLVWVSGDTTWPVDLLPDVAGVLTIEVVDQTTGAPVAGASVVVRDVTLFEAAAGVTDAEGVLITPELPSGVYTINIDVDGYASFSSQVVVSGPRTFLAHLEGMPGGPLTVEVVSWTDEGLLPIDGASIVVRTYRTGIEMATGVTDAAGRFVTADLPGGTYVVDVTAPGYMDASGAAMVNGGGWVSIELSPTPELDLALTNEAGAPGRHTTVSGFGFLPKERVVILWGGVDGEVLATVKAKKDGSISRNVRIPSVPAGQYRVVAVGEESGIVAGAIFTVVPAVPAAVRPQ